MNDLELKRHRLVDATSSDVKEGVVREVELLSKSLRQNCLLERWRDLIRSKIYRG